MRRILTVDDSASVRQMVSFTLRKAGYEVAEAVDGKDGLDKVSKEKFDMIITDLNMPNVDGIQLIATVRKLAGCSFRSHPHVDHRVSGGEEGCGAQSRRHRLDCEAFQCRSVDFRGPETGQVGAPITA